MKPKILHLDIENCPSLGWYYDLWKEGNIVGNKSEWYILSVAWRWAHEKKTRVAALVDYPLYKKESENDRALLEQVWKLLDEADIVVAHNGDKFDLPKLNARFFLHGMKPPSPYKTVDTYKVAKKYFKLSSNRLDSIARALKIGHKLPNTGFDLWRGCMAGDKKSWALMKRYNMHDVNLLVEVYLKMLPWMQNHPNYGVFLGEDACRNCGNTNLQRRGHEPTKTGLKQRFQCVKKHNGQPGCGAWSYGTSRKVVDVR